MLRSLALVAPALVAPVLVALALVALVPSSPAWGAPEVAEEQRPLADSTVSPPQEAPQDEATRGVIVRQDERAAGVLVRPSPEQAAGAPQEPPPQAAQAPESFDADNFYYFLGGSYRTPLDGPFEGENIEGAQSGFLFRIGSFAIANSLSAHSFSRRNERDEYSKSLMVRPLHVSLLFSPLPPPLYLFIGAGAGLSYMSEELPQNFQFGEQIQLSNNEQLEKSGLAHEFSFEVLALLDFGFPISIIPHFSYGRSFGSFLFREESDLWQISVNLAL